ncbi:hypothetical protein HDV00_011286 [Rhizophlyctis rosea]|nr:hypothetical protein HDV00_011286 [Rhizophlyctis rosea]
MPDYNGPECDRISVELYEHPQIAQCGGVPIQTYFYIRRDSFGQCVTHRPRESMACPTPNVTNSGQLIPAATYNMSVIMANASSIQIFNNTDSCQGTPVYSNANLTVPKDYIYFRNHTGNMTLNGAPAPWPADILITHPMERLDCDLAVPAGASGTKSGAADRMSVVPSVLAPLVLLVAFAARKV